MEIYLARRKCYFFSFLFFFLLLLSAFPLKVEGLTVQTGSLNLNVSGEKTWGLNFGLGNGESLSRRGYPDNSINLEQSLTVKVEGRIDPYISLNIDLDDSKPNYLQKFDLRLKAGNWEALLGDFTLGGEKVFTVYNKDVRGINLQGKLGRFELNASLARVMGLSKTKVFYGHSAEDERIFSYKENDEERTPYRRNIEGLYFYGLEKEYVEGFTEPSVLFPEEQSLRSFLVDWGLGYLEEKIKEEPSKPLLSGQFKPLITDETDYLLLMREINNLIRSFNKNFF